MKTLIYAAPAIKGLKRWIGIFTHLKLCLGTATHNFKWVKYWSMHKKKKIARFSFKFSCLKIKKAKNDNKRA